MSRHEHGLVLVVACCCLLVPARFGVPEAQLEGARACPCLGLSCTIIARHHQYQLILIRSASLLLLPCPCDLSAGYPTLAHVLASLLHSSHGDLCTLCSPRSEPSVASRHRLSMQRQSPLFFLTPSFPLGASGPHANRHRTQSTNRKFCNILMGRRTAARRAVVAAESVGGPTSFLRSGAPSSVTTTYTLPVILHWFFPRPC